MREGKCPFLELKTVTFCKAFPVKMIPVDKASSTKGLCGTARFEECSLYKEISSPSARMESVRGIRLRTDCYYHPRHAWLSTSADEKEAEGTVGVDDFASRLAGRIDRLSVPSEGSPLREGHVCLLLHSGERTARIAAPADGVVKAVNPRVAKDPSLIAHDPYRDGWIFSMKLSGEGAKGLFYGSSAKKWLECEVDRLQRALASDLGLTATDGGEAISDISARLTEAQWSRVVGLFLG
jgi:glycine cleavage system H protein